jgi:hypothetical protein
MNKPGLPRRSRDPKRSGLSFVPFSLCSLVVILVGAGFAQQRTPERINPEALRQLPAADVIKKPPVRAALKPGLLQVQSRPAIAFKPFAMVDPRTNKPIAPTTTIALPNGKKPTAQQYYDQLNSFEKWLAEHGYSLHTTPRNAQIKLQEVALNRELLERQIQMAPKPTTLQRNPNFRSVYSAKSLSTMQPIRLEPNHPMMARVRMNVAAGQFEETNRKISAAGVQGAMRDGMVISTASLAQLAKLNPVVVTGGPQPKCTPVNDARNWNWNVGDPSSFAAYVNGSLTLNGEACQPADMSHFDKNDSHFTVTAEGKAGGTIFGVGGDMLRATGNLGGNQATGTVSAGLGVFVLGQDVFSVNQTANGHWEYDNNVSKGVDFSTSIPIPVGPFDIDLTIGAQGSVGFEYSISLYPMSVNLSGGPFAHTNVYAQAGLNLVIAEAGVGASLTLVNWDMNLGGSAGVGWLLGFYLYDDVYADSNLNLLGGSVYVYAKVYYPCLDPWPDICDSQWQANLWSWGGLQYNSVLFDQKNVIPLKW